MSQCATTRRMEIVCSCGKVCRQKDVLEHLGDHQEKMELCSEVEDGKEFYCGPCNLMTKNLLTFKKHLTKKTHKAAVYYACVFLFTKNAEIAKRELFSNHDWKTASNFIQTEYLRQVGTVYDVMRPANILKNE
ncbi:hypothetical protein A9K97_gp109 [Tokyovirus A1]|uniref:hypothetical protein n=1 Tax=Tokyovirus A1 TaxID=1826170 RepID=UPI0007A96950|nr:hypothetical protein A9K97_gp109 [Tokyovirus A1]BAU80242.1 hypothetical protein [Tokyovirus A1]